MTALPDQTGPTGPKTGAKDLPRLRSVHRQVPRFASLRTIVALMLREMTSTYGKSAGGYVWAILEPALGIAVLVMIFSLGFRSPPLGSNFAIYYASGLLPFFMFNHTMLKVQQAINFSRNLLGYPRVTYLDALLARWLLTILTHGIVSYLILYFLLVTYDTRTALHIWQVLNAFLLAAVLGFGIGVMNCLLISRNPIWQSVWAVLTRPLILISGVIFLPDNIPEPYRGWLMWNPLVHVTGEARRGFYYSYVGDYVSMTYAYGVAFVTLALGLLFLNSYHRDLMER